MKKHLLYLVVVASLVRCHDNDPTAEPSLDDPIGKVDNIVESCGYFAKGIVITVPPGGSMVLTYNRNPYFSSVGPFSCIKQVTLVATEGHCITPFWFAPHHVFANRLIS